jgi:hypothetical protein
LEIAVADFYGAYKDATTDLHRNLAALPFPLVIETSPYSLMLNALREAKKQPRSAHYNFRRSLPEPKEPTSDEPLVYHLYGRADADLESLVLSESDLVDFLASVVKNEPELPRWLRGLLGRPDCAFLFLGFGFQNWYLRVLLHALGMMSTRRSGYALEDATFFQHPDYRQTVAFFRGAGGAGIKFHPLSWTDFALQLRRAYDAAGGQEQMADAPLVFLSYASEDEAAVNALYSQLQARGIRVWQDRKNLRGGDNWDRVLKHVIAKDVDYVVVAQSKTMWSREGVYGEEIAAALKRKERLLAHRFIIPVALDDCKPLPMLEDLDLIDVRGDVGVEALVASILEDWKGRRALSSRAKAA